MPTSVDFGGLKLDDAAGSAGGGGVVRQVVSVNIAADVTTTAVPPVYTVLMTAPAVVLAAAGRLEITFYAAWNHGGAFAGNVAANFRFLRNAVLMPASRGTTGNQVRGRIDSVAFTRVLAVAAGAHTISVEWAGFGLAGNTLQILAATTPDLMGAQLVVKELAP